jgi:hypothetical protein
MSPFIPLGENRRHEMLRKLGSAIWDITAQCSRTEIMILIS